MSSGFISEAELAERRRVRQEEWEKVRKPDDPQEAPEEQYDHRSLYERLEEQKQKREMEYEEAHKLKNMIKGLDDDEVQFLDLVDRTKLEQERLKSTEEAREIKHFREAVASLQEKSLEQRINSEMKQTIRPASSQPSGISGLGGRSSQTRLLAGAVVRKRPLENADSSDTKKARIVSDEGSAELKVAAVKSDTNETNESALKKRKEREEEEDDDNIVKSNGNVVGAAMHCIGILPGLGFYHDSSDSEQSSDTDQELLCSSGFDLLGRKIQTSNKKSNRSSAE